MVRVFKEYGEERFARRMVGAVVRERASRSITRTADLAEILKVANPAWEKHKHPATRAFQAIRIAVNNELGDLEGIPGGRSRPFSWARMKRFTMRSSRE